MIFDRAKEWLRPLRWLCLEGDRGDHEDTTRDHDLLRGRADFVSERFGAKRSMVERGSGRPGSAVASSSRDRRSAAAASAAPPA